MKPIIPEAVFRCQVLFVVDDIAQFYFSKAGIYSCSRVAKSDIEKIARATGGHIISSLSELNASELGKSQVVREVKQGESKMTYIEGFEMYHIDSMLPLTYQA